MTPKSNRSLHELAEERSLAYHRAVARRLESEPEILDRARRRVDAWIHEGGRAVAHAQRWREILDRRVAEIAAVLTDEGEEARALRQSTPFAGVLEPRERWRLWREVRSQGDSR